MKLINQKEGALVLKCTKESQIVLNWANGMTEVWWNGVKEFCINHNGEKE